MHIAELYRQVTARIISELEQGAVPWTKPWKTLPGTRSGIMPINASTGHGYRGINVPILWGAAHERGYATNGWMSYKQAEGLKAQVRKGEKGTRIVFTKKLRVAEDETTKTVGMLKVSTVFNIAQIDGLKEETPTPDVPLDERYTQARAFIDKTGARIQHGGDTACYIPSLDLINMPPRSSFSGEEHYMATTLHELTHWTGAKARLDRDLSNRFGSQAYAAEELIAEMGAAFLCAHLGIEGDLRHSGYIDHWLKLLKQDDRAIFTAASKASQASDYLMLSTSEAP